MPDRVNLGYPRYRRRAFERAYLLASHPVARSDASGAEQCEHAVAFLDKIVEALRGDDKPIANRLEARGAVRALIKRTERPTGWSESEWQELERFRAGVNFDDDEDGVEEPAVGSPGSEPLNKLAADSLIDGRFLYEVRALLEKRRQTNFYGPPDTGKIYLARRLVEFLTGRQTAFVLLSFTRRTLTRTSSRASGRR